MSSDCDYNCVRWICGVRWNWTEKDCCWFMCSEIFNFLNLGLNKLLNLLLCWKHFEKILWVICSYYQRTISKELERFVHYFHKGIVDHHGGSEHGEMYDYTFVYER